MSKEWPQDFVFTLQMDAEAEDKTLRTRTKGAKGELASRFPISAPTTPWHVGMHPPHHGMRACQCSGPNVQSPWLQLPWGSHFQIKPGHWIMALEAKKYYESGVKGLRKVQVICDAFFFTKSNHEWLWTSCKGEQGRRLHGDLRLLAWPLTAKGKDRIARLQPKQVLMFMLSGLVAPNLNLVQVKWRCLFSVCPCWEFPAALQSSIWKV